MDITQRYQTQTGKNYLIKFSYNENIRERDDATAFVQNLDVTDAETKQSVSLPITTARFSTFERFTSFARTARSTTRACATRPSAACGPKSSRASRIFWSDSISAL